MTAKTDTAQPENSAAVSGSDHGLVGQLSEAWNHLSASLVGMRISDPRWKPAVDWLNANRRYQKPIPRLPKDKAQTPPTNHKQPTLIMLTPSKPETIEGQTAQAVEPAVICSPLPDQRVVEVLDWLHTAMCELESVIRTLSPDPNSRELLGARGAIRRAQSKIREITDMSAVCQANTQAVATASTEERNHLTTNFEPLPPAHGSAPNSHSTPKLQ